MNKPIITGPRVTITGKFFRRMLAVFFLAIGFSIPALSMAASDFTRPWKNRNQALVIDAYERNGIDWGLVVQDTQVRAFIGKSSDGLPPRYTCKMRNKAKRVLCKKTFQNYWLKRELYHTRKTAAKSMGLKWGAYHLGRPGNPVKQANHFIDFAQPQPDELIALDIEHDDPGKWISFSDAEVFARQIKKRLGRYPVLYTNHSTAREIAKRRAEFPLLSRLPLWYARYKEDIRGVFPLGHWKSYTLWQFSSHLNCNKQRCPYRVSGTRTDIDVNATGLTIAEFENAWPFTKSGGAIPSSKAVAQNRKKGPARISATRYRVSYSFELGDQGTVYLDTIAIPTPRIEPTLADLVDPMVVGSIDNQKISADGNSYSPRHYGYTTRRIKYKNITHHNERYLY